MVVLSFAMLGSNGSCQELTGPGYGQGYGQGQGQGYGQGQAPSQTFYQPSIGAQRVDWCLHWGAQCGEPAATAYCQRVGYQRATGFQQAPNIGLQSPTLVLGDGATCNQAFCTGFDSITCTDPLVAGPGPGAPPPPDNLAQFSYEPNTNRPGMDFKKDVLQKPKPKQCKKRCRNNANCRAYTFVRPGVQHPTKAVCWLKHGVPAPVFSNCCTSGVKQ